MTDISMTATATTTTTIAPPTLVDRPSILEARLADLPIGTEVEITAALYDQYMNVLPPLRLGSDWFWFAEGADRVHEFKLDAARNRAVCRLIDKMARG